MKNKEGLLSKLKVEVFKSKRYDGKIADLKKEKESYSKNIKQYILKNKAMFKRERLSDFFTQNFVCQATYLISVFTLILSVSGMVYGDDEQYLDNLSYVITPSFIMMLFFMCLSLCDIKSEKAKFLSKLKYLHNDKRKIMASLEKLNNDKGKVLLMIENFQGSRDYNNKGIISLPVSSDFLKVISLHFSEDEIEKMIFMNDGESLNYYDVLSFIDKTENE